MSARIAVVIPVYNGGALWEECAKRIKNNFSGRIIVIDSSSTDNSGEVARQNGFELYVIPSIDFNHGKTRNYGISLVKDDADYVIFLTQDALLEGTDSITNLVSFLASDPKLAAAYGRQLPHNDANPLATYARNYNYASKSYVTDLQDSRIVGIKKAFLSNSFSVYNIRALVDAGCFPENTILCEDMFFAAKSILRGFKIGYCATALVRHSHNYSAIEEFKRYFDIGVFHAQEGWIAEKIGSAGGEGKKYVASELQFLIKAHVFWMPVSIINNACKFIGYKLGMHYKSLPRGLVKMLSMHKRYWK